MRNKKMIPLGMALLLGVGVVSSCSGKPKINFWTGFGTAVSGVIEPLISEYEKANPEYDITYESKGGYDGLQKAISLSASTGNYPHLAVGYPDHMAGYIVSDILQPLDSFIEQEEAGFLDDFLPAYLKENQELTYRRKTDGSGGFDYDRPFTMGLPFNKSTEVVVANQTMMDYFYAVDETIVMPKSWEELAEVGAKMVAHFRDNDLSGKIVKTDKSIYTPAEGETYTGDDILLDFTGVKAGEFRPFSWDSTANMFITLVRQWGAEYTTMGADSRTGKYLFNNETNQPKVVKMMAFMKKIYDEGIIGIPATWGESSYSSNPFNANKIAMTVSSSAGVKFNVPAGNKFKISVNPLLYHVDAEGTAHKTVISQGTNLMMFQKGNDEVKQAAWNFIKFMTTKVNDRFAIGAAYYPVTYTMASSTTYTEFLNQDTTDLVDSDVAVIEAANVNANVYTNDEENWYKFVDPAFVGSSEIRFEVGNTFGILFAGEGSNLGENPTDTQREVWAKRVLGLVTENLKKYA
ncbi:MAG: extracellular solute-binding protein [Bacilli bacterium]|jgi:multiple sugar transport system substrate-binding protein